MYNLSGLSFREFLELETNQTFPVYSFADMVERHEEIVEDILKHVRPLAYFNNYLNTAIIRFISKRNHTSIIC